MWANMRVTFVCAGFARSTILLQPWRRVYEISRRLSSKGISVTIITDKKSEEPQTEKIIDIIVKRTDRLTFVPIIGKQNLIRLMLENDPDLIVWYGTPTSALFLTQFRKVKKPFFWDIDSDIYNLQGFRRFSFREFFDPHHFFFLQQLVSALFPRCMVRMIANSSLIDRIIVPSQALRNSLCTIGVKPEKTEIIQSTIDSRSNSSLESSKNSECIQDGTDHKNKQFVATYFGSPCTLRGVDTAILGINKILKNHQNIRLIILSRPGLGKSSTEQYLKAEEKYLIKLVRDLGIENNVEIVSGVLNKSTLIQYLCRSDAILLPFKLILSEPPLSILEAMSFGKVVITTNLGTISEIIGNNRGILIEPSNPQSLAQAVLFLIDHPEKQMAIGQNAKKFVSNLPNWDQIARQYENLINQIVKK